MQANSQQPPNTFPNRFFGLGLKGFLLLAAILLLLEIAVIFAIFGTDLFFNLIDELTSVTPGAVQINQIVQSCVTTARTMALLHT
ncbi:MAG: hypothetical protein ACOY4O_14175 [Pseudomonadota bacterium]